MKDGKKFCKECEHSNWYHLNTWFEELTTRFLPQFKLPRRIEAAFDIVLERIFIVPKIARFRTDFSIADIQLRSSCFIKEMRKRGATCYAMQSIFGYTTHFKIEVDDGKTFRFETLPIAEFANKYNTKIVDDKELTKQHCKKGGFPIADGQSFWFWQKRKAVQFGENDFPLVVKPRSGSVSRHVTTNIQNNAQLEEAIHHAISYSPTFIIERFIPNTSVYRATVIDFDFVVCTQQVPANVVGDGILTIRKLIDKKNKDPRRGASHQKQFTLYKIVENETTKELLAEKGCTNNTILKKGETLYLQKDPFLKLGGDLIEVTPIVHKDNLKLFSELARFFDTRLTGIDFLAQDITISWKKQPCAILELNNVPCIELHHFPSSGAPTNPAKALADMFFKYYLVPTLPGGVVSR